MFHVPVKYGIAQIDHKSYRGVNRVAIHIPVVHGFTAPFYDEYSKENWTEMCSSQNRHVLNYVFNRQFWGFLDWEALAKNPHPLAVRFLTVFKDDWV
jgi:hypothetical protein